MVNFHPSYRVYIFPENEQNTIDWNAVTPLVGEGTTSKETVDGPRSIAIKDGMAFMEQLAPKYCFTSQWVSEGVKLDEVLFHPSILHGEFTPDLSTTLFGHRFDHHLYFDQFLVVQGFRWDLTK